MRKMKTVCLFVLLLCFTPMFAQQPSAEMTNANKLLKENKYSEAIVAYKEVLQKEADNSMAWFYIGSAEYSLNNYYEAINAYLKASEGLTGPVVCYNLAGVYALAGDKENAYNWLDKSVEKGFSQYQTLANDPDFESIKNEERFKKILKNVEIISNPCLAREEYKQFNFWVGKWDVKNPAGQHAGDSEIDLMNNGCTIVENWYGTRNFQGKSFNYFDPKDNKWHQFWINQNAQTIFFEGNLEDGNMVYYSYDHVKDMKDAFLRRLTFFNLGPNKVRQYSETSKDDGKTWETEYDLTYNRKVSSK